MYGKSREQLWQEWISTVSLAAMCLGCTASLIAIAVWRCTK